MKKTFSLGLAIGLPLAVGLLILITLNGAVASEDVVEVYTIGDTTGDWGFPTPHSHYSRGPGYVRMSYIFDTLVWKGDEGLVPALAESWDMESDDSFLFNLRKGVTWHDGEAFNADDVIFSVAYYKEHPHPWVDNRVIDRTERIDDYTVRLHLSNPYAPFLDQVVGTMPILPEHIWEEVDDPITFQEDEALIGTGPYTLADYDKVQGTYQYKAYEDYYLGTPKVKELRYVKISESTAVASLMQGDVNTASIEPEMIDQLSDFEILTQPEHWWNYKLMINHQKDPMSDKRFRQALAYAIDRQKLVDIAGRGYGLVGSPGFIPSDHNWYNPEIDNYYPHDVQKAQDLLNEMEYDGQDIELLVKGGRSVEEERIGELIKEDLENAGFNVNLRTMDSKTVDSKVKEWDFDLAVSGHGGLVGDPNFLSGNTINMKSFNSARYQDNDDLADILEAQVTEMDEDDRGELIDRAQIMYAEDVPALSLYYPDWFVAYDDQVDIYYTWNGMATGIPIAQNKLSFVGV